MRVLATYNVKGGVGKTTAAINLSYVSAARGARVLVWDLDPQGAATFYFRVKPKVKGGGRAIVTKRRSIDAAIKGTDFDNLDLLPADFSYRNLDLVLNDRKKPTRRLARLLAPLSADYDFVVLDCPPSISLVSESVFEASHLLVVPLIPTTLSLRSYDQLTGFLAGTEWAKLDVLPYFSMVDRRKRLHRQTIEAMAASRPDAFGPHIPASSEIERMGLHRAPLGAYSRTRAAAAFDALWGAVEARLAAGAAAR